MPTHWGLAIVACSEPSFSSSGS